MFYCDDPKELFIDVDLLHNPQLAARFGRGQLLGDANVAQFYVRAGDRSTQGASGIKVPMPILRPNR